MDPYIHVENQIVAGPILVVTRWPESINKNLTEGIASIICNNKTTYMNAKDVPLRKISNLTDSHNYGIEDHDDTVDLNDHVVTYSNYRSDPKFSIIELRRREIENILQYWVKFCEGKTIGECSIDVVIFEVTEVNGKIAMGGGWEYKKCIPNALESSYAEHKEVRFISSTLNGEQREPEPTTVNFELKVFEHSDHFKSKEIAQAVFNIMVENGTLTLATVAK